MADLGGYPPSARNFLNFMQFFAKFGKIIRLVPPPRDIAIIDVQHQVENAVKKADKLRMSGTITIQEGWYSFSWLI